MSALTKLPSPLAASLLALALAASPAQAAKSPSGKKTHSQATTTHFAKRTEAALSNPKNPKAGFAAPPSSRSAKQQSRSSKAVKRLLNK